MYFIKKFNRGIFNKYQKGMPLLEIMAKDINYLILKCINFFKAGFKNKTILVYPHYPSRRSTIYRIAKYMGYNITNLPSKKYNIAVYWEYNTHRVEFKLLEEKSNFSKIVNLYNRDISKVNVEKDFYAVFKYSTFVNPLVYKGKAVKKNDINAKHDGKIIDCPIDKTENEYIYQILIDNSHNDNLVMDIRVPVVKNLLDFVYIKYRNINERFTNTTIKTDLKHVTEIFSENEIELLNKFCEKNYFEYGELDVLRNKNDNKIYVVDVNNTPLGPPKNTTREDKNKAIKKIANEFKTVYNL